MRILIAYDGSAHATAAIEDLKRAGFVIIEQTDRFIDREKVKGDKMWVVVAEKR